MSTDVEALQQLLARVQHNRAQPRAAVSDMQAQSSSPQGMRAQPIALPESDDYAAPLAAPLAAPVPVAVEAPQAPLAQETPRRSVPIDLLPEPTTAVQFGRPQPLTMPSEMPASSPAAVRVQGAVIAEPVPAAPSRPIAETVSKSPQLRPMTFGDLLWRSLALRPR